MEALVAKLFHVSLWTSVAICQACFMELMFRPTEFAGFSQLQLNMGRLRSMLEGSADYDCFSVTPGYPACKLWNKAAIQGCGHRRQKNAARFRGGRLLKDAKNSHGVECRCGSQDYCQEKANGSWYQKQFQQRLANSDPQAKKMDQLMNEMLYADYLPFSTVKNPGFRHLLEVANPQSHKEVLKN